MKKKLLLTLALPAIALATAAAQSKPETTLSMPPANVKVDGSLKEWGDSLRYYQADKKLNYTLANDDKNIYVAIRFNDRTEQARVMSAGLTFGINTKGKKKETYSLTFPVADPSETGRIGMMAARRQAGEGEITQADRDEMLHERLTRLRNIKVNGFKSIEGDVITTTNTYGIEAAINYDDNGYLVYEAAIPLKLFDNYEADKKEWAFNFKINGITRPTQQGEGGERPGGGMGGGGMRGGRGGMGGNRGGSQGSADRTELFKSTDFWTSFYLNTGK